MTPKLKIGLVVVAILVVANLVVFSPRLKTLWKRAADQQKLAADQKRKQECIRELSGQFDAQQLVGAPVAKIADCLQFADQRIELGNGETLHLLPHPTAKNQEGHAWIGITIDSKGEMVVRAELVFPEW